MKNTGVVRQSWWIKAIAGVVALGAIVASPAVMPVRTARAADPKPITLGFIYVGSKSDYGYNQAQSEGAA